METIVVNGVDRKLNWKRQPSDVRDIELSNVMPMIKHLPTSGSTRTRAKPAIRDQGALGSCTAQAGCEAMAFVYMLLKKTTTDPLFSRLFGYYFTRKLEGTPTTEDSGCNVRDVFKAYRRYGLCLETTWPYDIAKFADEPPAAAIAEALKHEALAFYACPTINAIKQSITDGYPVIFGFDCFESLESQAVAKTGHIPLPGPHEASVGGHCMLIDGYNDAGFSRIKADDEPTDETDTTAAKVPEFTGQNSWGDWGDHGYFYLPQAYFTKGYASDAWTLRVEEA